MASTMALGPVITAVLAALRASVSLTGYVGARVYPDSNGDVPQPPSYPYVQVESASEAPFGMNTMGEPDALKYGSVARFNIRIGSTTRSDTQANSIASLVRAALDGQPLTVAGYGTPIMEYVDLAALKDFTGGVTTREWVLSFEAAVHQ